MAVELLLILAEKQVVEPGAAAVAKLELILMLKQMLMFTQMLKLALVGLEGSSAVGYIQPD